MLQKFILSACCFAMLSSCGSHKNNTKNISANHASSFSTDSAQPALQSAEENSSGMTSSTVGATSTLTGSYATSSAVTLNGSASGQSRPPAPAAEKKLIRSADFNCRVKNAFAAVKQMENVVKEMGGSIEVSKIENEVTATKEITKNDSIIQSHVYHTVATLVLRIPISRFDTLIHGIPGIVDFIVSRTIKENDVSLQYYGNMVHAEANKQRLAEMNAKWTNSKNAIEIADYKDRKQDEQTNRELDNLNLQGNVSFASVSVKFTQPDQVYTETVFNPESLSQNTFGENCRDAWATSMNIFKGIFLAVVTIWPLLLIVAGFVVGITLYKKRKRLLAA